MTSFICTWLNIVRISAAFISLVPFAGTSIGTRGIVFPGTIISISLVGVSWRISAPKYMACGSSDVFCTEMVKYCPGFEMYSITCGGKMGLSGETVTITSSALTADNANKAKSKMVKYLLSFIIFICV